MFLKEIDWRLIKSYHKPKKGKYEAWILGKREYKGMKVTSLSLSLTLSPRSLRKIWGSSGAARVWRHWKIMKRLVHVWQFIPTHTLTIFWVITFQVADVKMNGGSQFVDNIPTFFCFSPSQHWSRVCGFHWFSSFSCLSLSHLHFFSFPSPCTSHLLIFLNYFTLESHNGEFQFLNSTWNWKIEKNICSWMWKSFIFFFIICHFIKSGSFFLIKSVERWFSFWMFYKL